MADFMKDYEPVEDRLAKFWADHPTGRVVTVLVHHGEGEYIVRAEVFRSDGELPAASGLAHDSSSELPPNMRVSALEVCETSAIGRALANLGYAPKGRRPSREEMQKASPGAGLSTSFRPAPGGSTSGPAAAGDLGRIPGPDPGPDASSSGAGGMAPGTGTGDRLSPPRSSPEGTPSGVGEASGTAAGGQTKPPAVTKAKVYPLDPAKCSHKFPSGRWLTWDDAGRCPRCGTPRLEAMEGTTADLGPA